MASPLEAAPLIASPSYPNSVAWSTENLIAVATGHVVTILNPASLMSPRGVAVLPPNKPFPFGLVETQDLLADCLMPASLTRDFRPCARSISWSHPGFAANSGCLLSVCTTAGRVKVYRPPFSEFCAEWIEVMDISDLMYDYLVSINFGVLEQDSTLQPEKSDPVVCTDTRNATISQNSVSRKILKPRKTKATSKRIEVGDLNSQEPNPCQQDMLYPRNTDLAASADENEILKSSTAATVRKCSSKHNKSRKRSSPSEPQRSATRKNGKNMCPRISAEKYASWSAFLSSLVIAWSPIFQLSERCSLNCSILAVGGKSGNISFWGFKEPHVYTIEHGEVSVAAELIGLLQAHKSWVTAISWGFCHRDASVSQSQLVLATGSSDGSVKLWLGDAQAVMRSSNPRQVAFALLKEVVPVTFIPISIISLVIPVIHLDEIVLAIGKGSGSLEIWRCYISSNHFESAGAYEAHDQVVTGLTWASNGSYLYSCSQDTTMRSWFLNEKHLCEAPFPSSFDGCRNLSNVLQICDPFFGLAISPGGSMITIVRSFDVDLLNRMYQRRQKAAVEFFWIGQQSAITLPDKPVDSVAGFSGLSDRELQSWEYNILRYLKHCENAGNALILWDVLVTLQFFRKSVPGFVENLLVKWISSWLLDSDEGASLEKILLLAQRMLLKLSTRKVHLLNIICRKLMMIELKADIPDGKPNQFDEFQDDQGSEQNLWAELLVNCERELRERLVAFTFHAVLKQVSFSTMVSSATTNWLAAGVAQMERWVSKNLVHDQLMFLGSKVHEQSCRIVKFDEEETCSLCSLSVPFESPEYGSCKGSAARKGSSGGSHRLERCAVTMKLCSVSSPMWHCICCQRWVATLAPETFFTLPESPLILDFQANPTSSQRGRPFCPFCGLLLQRMLPDFLLSPVLV